VNKIGFERLLIISNVLFCLLFVVLIVNNRPATDDFHFLDNVHKYGVLGGIAFEYNSWSPRWASVFITHLFLWIHEKTGIGLLLFGIISFSLITASMYLFLRKLNSFLVFNNWVTKDFFSRKKLNLNIALFAVSILFLSTFRIGELWFWLCSTSTYLWSNAFLLLGISGLLSASKSIRSYIFTTIPFVYIGGSCGPLSLITLVILITLGIATFYNLIKVYNKRTFLIKILLAFSTCLIAFSILFMAEGNVHRSSFFKEIGLMESFILNFKMTGIILLKRVPFSLLLCLLFCSPLLLINSDPKENKTSKSIWSKIIIMALIYCLIIFLFQWSITYKTQDVAAFRTLFFVNLLTLFFSAVLSFLLGFKLKKLRRFVIVEFPIALFAATVVFGVLLYGQSYITSEYAFAYDNRIEFAKKNCSDNKALLLDSLPKSGLLYSAELSRDPLFFSNQHFKAGLKIDCDVRLK
jgi:hypothetical protein